MSNAKKLQPLFMNYVRNKNECAESVCKLKKNEIVKAEMISAHTQRRKHNEIIRKTVN